MTGGILAPMTVANSVKLALWFLPNLVVQAQVLFLVGGVMKLSGSIQRPIHMVETLIASTAIMPASNVSLLAKL